VILYLVEMYSKLKIHNKPLHHFLREHFVLVILVAVAAFLRLYQLDTHGIFFFDTAHDLLAAQQSLQEGRLPLVGITSSRPWLHQGPLAIWIEMLIMLFFGTATLAQHIVFALIGVAAVIGLYELVTVFFSRRAAYVAVALLAVFPLAVANSRMPYHTTPIPLATVLYLWSLCLLWNKFSLKYLIFALLSGVVLFQFELCNAPLLLLIPYVFWRKKYQLSKKVIAFATLAGFVGLLPQLLFHVFGGSNQVFEFSKWLVTQILERLQGGTATIDTTAKTLQAFWVFGGRIFGVDVPILSIAGLVSLLSSSLYILYKIFKNASVPAVVELAGLGLWLLVAAYFLAGPPSEAYFPPFFICIPILFSYVFVSLSKKLQLFGTGLILIFMGITVYSIFTANFFVMNNRAFQYDSVGEKRAIARALARRTANNPYQLKTAERAEVQFSAFFEHIEWLALEEKIAGPSEVGKVYFLEKNSDPQPPETILIQKFPTKTVYWHPERL
jgi:4-amino-4-deoxy-L-arabinose transferase-like glycosyltransferase